MKQTRGFGLVYQPTYVDKRTGEHKTAATWWVQYSIRGKRFRESSGSANRADAMKLLKHRIGEAAQGRVIAPQAEKTTFNDLEQMLLDDYDANRRRSLKRIRIALKHLRVFFGDALAIEITGDRVSSYVALRKEEKAAAATINRELSALARSFRVAERAGKVISRPEVSKLQEHN